MLARAPRRTVLLSFINLEIIAFSGAAAPLPAQDGLSSSALFHLEESLDCADCHLVVAGKRADGGFLHKPDISDLCLACHTEGQNTPVTADLPDVEDGGWVAPIVLTTGGGSAAKLGIAMPAGDFYWANVDPRKGHNPAFSPGAGGAPTSRTLAADPVLGVRPPGGTLVEPEWSCHSCHGSHSRFDPGITAWRQLKRRVNGRVVTGDVRHFGVETVGGDAAQDPEFEPIKSNSRGILLAGDVTAARADGQRLEGADLFHPEGDTNKNIYRGGFSSFCAACHGDFHDGPGGVGGRTRPDGTWIRHPGNRALAESSRYGVSAYAGQVLNAQGTSPNLPGYDWKYPLVKADFDFSVRVNQAAAEMPGTVRGSDRIMCLTCHRAHASPFRNMTRWDTEGHAFIAAGEVDFVGEASNGDNPAYGCSKCHQVGGLTAYVKGF